MPFPCLSPAALKANSHIPCRSPAAVLPRPCRYPAILRRRAGRPHAISGRPKLIHTYHAVPMPCCSVALRGRFQNGVFVAWQGNGMGMACVNQTRPHSVNQMGKTQSKPLAARNGRGKAWVRHENSTVCVN
jgi:hypothetical protein